MPIYEYQCKDCNNEFEDLVLNRASEPQSCPQCGSSKITRLVSTFGMIGETRRGTTSSCAGCKSHSCSSCGV